MTKNKLVYTTQTVQDMLLRATLCMPHLRLAAGERGFNGTIVSESSRVLAFLHEWLVTGRAMNTQQDHEGAAERALFEYLDNRRSRIVGCMQGERTLAEWVYEVSSTVRDVAEDVAGFVLRSGDAEAGVRDSLEEWLRDESRELARKWLDTRGIAS